MHSEFNQCWNTCSAMRNASPSPMIMSRCVCIYKDTNRGESRPINRTAIDWFILFALSFFSRYFLRQLSMKKKTTEEKNTNHTEWRLQIQSVLFDDRKTGKKSSLLFLVFYFFSLCISAKISIDQHYAYLACSSDENRASTVRNTVAHYLKEKSKKIKNDAIRNKNIVLLAREVCISVTFSCVIILVLAWFCIVHSLTWGDRVRSSNENNEYVFR